MASSTKGIYWSEAEIEHMLKALYRIGAGRKVMTSTNLETTTLFQQVSEKMKDKGYNRISSQIRAKFKKEKLLLRSHGGTRRDSRKDTMGTTVWTPATTVGAGGQA